MTPFCKVDSLTYFIKRHGEFFEVVFFVIIFRKMKKNIFFYILSP
ncbi:unnamed protein product, partial [Staurois parvus]